MADENLWKVLGEEQREFQPWVLFGYIKDTSAPLHGYEFAKHGAQEIECYGLNA
jgi:hypothetical protein